MTDHDPQLSDRLRCAVKYQAELEPDLYFVSEDGRKVPAHRSVLTIHSSLIKSVLADYPGYLTPSILIPGAQYSSLCSLVSLLYTGKCVPGDDLHHINSLAREIIRVDLNILEDSTQPEDDGDIIEENLIDPLSEPKVNVKPGPKSLKRRFLAPGSLKEAKLVSCQICPGAETYPSMVEFQQHLSVKHFLTELTVSYGGRNTNCKLCGRKFVTEEKLAAHLGIQHNKVLELYPKRVSTLTDRIVGKYGVNELQCGFCQIKFKNKQLLGTHIGAVHKKLEEFLLAEKQPEIEIEIQ